MSNIEIDAKSGFCFGVVRAIDKAEEELAKGGPLYCLGDIVHNEKEVQRLEKMGLITITHDDLKDLHNAKVMFRAHGEPPSTYELAVQNNIELIDASCPVVLKLQKRVKNAYDVEEDGEKQIVIYGKPGHAEVIGILGQVGGNAIVVESEADLDKVDFTKNTKLFSQTTKSLDGFNKLVKTMSERMAPDVVFEHTDTICRQVSNRMPNIAIFAEKNEIVLFVAGKKSSNGKVLYEHAKSINPNTYFVSNPKELDNYNIDLSKSIGICGATSTPRWLMEAVAERLEQMKALAI